MVEWESGASDLLPWARPVLGGFSRTEPHGPGQRQAASRQLSVVVAGANVHDGPNSAAADTAQLSGPALDGPVDGAVIPRELVPSDKAIPPRAEPLQRIGGTGRTSGVSARQRVGWPRSETPWAGRIPGLRWWSATQSLVCLNIVGSCLGALRQKGIQLPGPAPHWPAP